MFDLSYRVDSFITLAFGMALIAASYYVLTFLLPEKWVEYAESRLQPLGYLIVAILWYFVWFDPFDF